MFDHARGFFRRQVQPVLPQVAVFQAVVLAELLAIRHQGEQAGVAAHQAAPGVENAVVVAFDEGAEIQRVAQQRGVVAVDIRLIDAQQGMAEHRRGAVQVGRREHQHRAVRIDVGDPVSVFGAVGAGQVIELQLRLEPAGTRRVDALWVTVAQFSGLVQGLQGRLQFGCRVAVAIFCEKEIVVVDIAAPAAELAGLVVAEGDPVGVVGQLFERGGMQGRTEAQGKDGEYPFQDRCSSGHGDGRALARLSIGVKAVEQHISRKC